MIKLSIDFLKCLTTLPSERIKKVPKFVQMLHANPNLPSLRLKRLATVHLYSARLDDGYRAILARRGGDFVLVRVDRREEAYEWVARNAGYSKLPEIDFQDGAVCGTSVPETDASDSDTRVGTEKPKPPKDGLEIGNIHSWASLKERFAWDSEHHGYYLPEKDGRIICACLREDLNPSAPWEILVGTGPAHIRKAEMLARETAPIPVFIKLAVDQWEYWGRFRFDRCESDPEKFRPLLPTNRTGDTSMVLFLADSGE